MRRVTSGSVFTDVEMQTVIPTSGSTRNPSNDRAIQVEDTRASLIGTDVFIDDVETASVITNPTLRDTAIELVQQNKASFSTKSTFLSLAGTMPSILKELSHHVPGLGAVLASTYFADDIRNLNRIRHRMLFTRDLINDNFEDTWTKRLVSFQTSVTINRIFENTLLFTISQLERRYNKQANSIVGRALQVMGSGLTFAGLFTHGATVPLGFGVGAAGTLVRARFGIRSAYNYVSKWKNNTLSVNREEHARYLYGLTLLHLQQTGKHDGNYASSREARRSVERAKESNGNYLDEIELAAEFVGSFEGLEYLNSEIPTQKQLDHFLEYGLWSIMLGIKS